MPIVERCEVCNVRLPRVQREDTRYCGSTCRVRASRARRKGRSRADLMRRFAWARTLTATRSWVVLWYRRLAHGPLRALAMQRREAQALRMQLAEAQATLQRQSVELAQLKEQLATVAEQAAREAASSLELRSELISLEVKERTTDSELQETRARGKRIVEEAESLSLALRAERQRNTSLGNQLAAMREQSDAQLNQTQRLAAQLACAHEESGKRQAELVALAQRLDSTVRTLDRTMAEVRTARAERDTAQVRALTLESALEKSQWLLGIKTRETEEIRGELAVAEGRITRLRRKLAKVRVVSAKRKRRANALGKQLVKAKQDAEQQLAEHKRALQQGNERIAQQEESIQRILGERAIAKAEAMILQSGVNILTTTLQQEIKKSQELETELGQASASNEALTLSLSESNASAQKTQQALESYKAATEKELSELRAYRKRTQEPSEELKEAKKEICQLKGAVFSAENKRDEARRTLEIGRGNWASLERNLLAQVSQLKEQVRTLTEERDRRADSRSKYRSR